MRITLLSFFLSITLMGTSSIGFVNPTQTILNAGRGVSNLTSTSSGNGKTELFTWADRIVGDNPIKYAVYNFVTNEWVVSPTFLADTTTAACGTIFNSTSSKSNQAILSWGDWNVGKPYYAIFDFNTLSLAQGPQSIEATINNWTANTYNYKHNKALLSWTTNGNNVGLAIYNFSTGELSLLPEISDVPVYSANVFCSSNQEDKAILTWRATDGSIYYSLFDFGSNSIALAPTQIPGVNSRNDIIPSFNNAGTALMSWVDSVSGNPYCITYDLEKNSFGSPLELSSEGIGGNGIVANVAALKYNQTMITWSSNTSLSYYAIYDFSTNVLSTPATVIDSSIYINRDVMCSYNSGLNLAIASWITSIDTLFEPQYRIYYFPSLPDSLSSTLLHINNKYGRISPQP